MSYELQIGWRYLYAGHREPGLIVGFVLSLVLAAIVGLAAMYGMYWLMQGIASLNSAGNERIGNALEKMDRGITPSEEEVSAAIVRALRSRTGRVIMPAWQKRQPRVQPRKISTLIRSWTDSASGTSGCLGRDAKAHGAANDQRRCAVERFRPIV